MTMYVVALILALVLTWAIKEKTGVRVLVILVLSTATGFIVGVIGGFFIPSLAVTLTTRNALLYAVGMDFVGAIIGMFLGYIVTPIVAWLEKLGK